MKKKPTGFTATCQCGVVVGAMDFNRTERKEAGHILGKWIADGCIITPQFNGDWSVIVRHCECLASVGQYRVTKEEEALPDEPWTYEDER